MPCEVTQRLTDFWPYLPIYIAIIQKVLQLVLRTILINSLSFIQVFAMRLALKTFHAWFSLAFLKYDHCPS